MLVAHLSDPHLSPRGALYKGLVDSNTMFEAALAHLAGLRLKPDLVIVTGDLVDEGTAAEYGTVREMLGRIEQPLLVIPGNHDDHAGFRECFADHAFMPKTWPFHFVAPDRGPLRIVALDVTVPGAHHGEMAEAAAAWLDRTLAAAPERPTLIMMHLPPFSSGIPYIDQYGCRHGERLAEVVARYPAVERIVCGHIHRFMQLRFAGTMLCTAPSTTTAIALRLQQDAMPASYVEPPAMLLHHWKPDTGLITHFVPIGSFPGPFPFA